MMPDLCGEFHLREAAFLADAGKALAPDASLSEINRRQF